MRRSSYGPPVSAISSGGRRLAASPSSASGFWSKEKMKYDFGFTSPSRLSVRAESSKAIPVRSRSSLSTASRGMCGKRAISPSTRAVRDSARRRSCPQRSWPGRRASRVRRRRSDSVKPCKAAPGLRLASVGVVLRKLAHRRAARPGLRRARRVGRADDADARRHVRARRPVHAARPGRDPHRPRAAADGPLRAAPDALERDDPGPRARHRDAEAALARRRRWSASTATSSPAPGGRAAS